MNDHRGGGGIRQLIQVFLVGEAFFEVSEDVFIDVFMCKKPVIAAMNGSAMAGRSNYTGSGAL